VQSLTARSSAKWWRSTARLSAARTTRRREHGPPHQVSAWASEQGLVLGQRAVDGKSNEITAVPELLDTLRLDGRIVTLDALGCRRDIAARIRGKRADYLLVLETNHGRAFEEGQGCLVRRRYGPGRQGSRALARLARPEHGAGGGDDPRRQQVLDITFCEDDSRVRDRTAARNLALPCKIALNFVAGDRGNQTNLCSRRKRAAWNGDYMLRIIGNQAHA
jgi:predicted transposase YbfD/YdcC